MEVRGFDIIMPLQKKFIINLRVTYCSFLKFEWIRHLKNNVLQKDPFS